AAGALGVAVAAAGGRHYSGLVAGAAVFGISVAFGNPATNQLAARGVTPGRHGLVTGVKQSGVQIGAFLAGLVLPALAGAAGWRAALGGCALVGAVGLGLIGRYVPRPAAGTGDTPPRPAASAGDTPAR